MADLDLRSRPPAGTALPSFYGWQRYRGVAVARAEVEEWRNFDASASELPFGRSH